jgi:hypothetical protein
VGGKPKSAVIEKIEKTIELNSIVFFLRSFMVYIRDDFLFELCGSTKDKFEVLVKDNPQKCKE